jgi:hypothetical protein
MLRALPRTSKKTSPRRGSGTASDADMEPMVTLVYRICLVGEQLMASARRRSGSSFPDPAARSPGLMA